MRGGADVLDIYVIQKDALLVTRPRGVIDAKTAEAIVVRVFCDIEAAAGWLGVKPHSLTL